MRKILFLVALAFVCSTSLAQNTRNAETPKPRQPQYQAAKKEKKSLLGFLKKDRKVEHKTAEEEKLAFRKRVSNSYKENAKTEFKASKVKRKEAKKGEQFHGHKRPPKKRPPGKQKFCKICKIKH